jgi:hypothetical protein
MQPRVVGVEDELLASQVGRSRPVAFLPEKRLMGAVLAVAFADYQKYAATTDVWNRRRFAEVEYWFMLDDTCWPFSFVTICEALDLDAASIRAGVRACREGPAIVSPAFFGRG